MDVDWIALESPLDQDNPPPALAHLRVCAVFISFLF